MTRTRAGVAYIVVFIAGVFAIAGMLAALLNGLALQIACVVAGNIWVRFLLAHWRTSRWEL